MMSDHYQAELAGGVRFDDAAFGIDWPLPISCISAADRACPEFHRADYCTRYRQALAGGEQAE